MLSEEIRQLLHQCGGTIEIVVDNARSHSDSVTQSVEQLPPLRPYSKSVGIAKRKRNQQRSITMDRWTAERRAPSPSFASPVSSPKLMKTTSPSMGSVDSSNSSSDSQDLSPRLVRRLPSNDGMANDSYCDKDLWKGSPRRPTRRESVFDVCSGATFSNHHYHDENKDSNLLCDFSPRKPARRRVSFLPEEMGKSNESATTVQFIIEALAIANLYGGDDIKEETVNNSSDESTVSSFASTSSSSEKPQAPRSSHAA
jgi:hypothetical protein